ncbi:MAG: GTP-binding protein [Bacteroidota bacterium]
MSPIPVTIITGFLGAGKTTLLNEIIAQHPDQRFAIIENEFGEIGIDQELVIGAEDGIFEMSNGCICCALNKELIELLVQLYQRRADFDHLLIETTGIADPAAVVAAFISDPTVQEYYRLDAMLCMVDSRHIESNLFKEREATQQISYADVLIFNKKDLVTPEELERLQKMVQEINPYAQVLHAEHGEVDTKALLKLAAFDPKVIEQRLKELPHHHDHHHQHITSQSYRFDQDFDLMKFRHFMQVLLMFQNMRIYRIKGILSFAHLEERMIFQSVQQQTIFRKGSTWQENEKRESCLVIIGHGLDRKAFDKKLKECLAKVESKAG